MSITIDTPTQNSNTRFIKNTIIEYSEEQIKAIEQCNFWIMRLKKFATNRKTRHKAWESSKRSNGTGYLISMCNKAIDEAYHLDIDVNEMIVEFKEHGKKAWQLEIASSIGMMRLAIKSGIESDILHATLDSEFIGRESGNFNVHMKTENPFIKFHKEVVARTIEVLLNLFPEGEDNFGKRIWKGNVAHMLKLAEELQLDVAEFRRRFDELALPIPKYVPTEN